MIFSKPLVYFRNTSLVEHPCYLVMVQMIGWISENVCYKKSGEDEIKQK